MSDKATARKVKTPKSRTTARSPIQLNPESIKAYFKTRTSLTTGDVAFLADVAPKTVCGWSNSGKIPSFRLPKGQKNGGGDRRFPKEGVIQFFKNNGIPLSYLEESTVISICIASDSNQEVKQQFIQEMALINDEASLFNVALSFAEAKNLLGLGIELSVKKPDLLIVFTGYNLHTRDELKNIAKFCRESEFTQISAFVDDEYGEEVGFCATTGYDFYLDFTHRSPAILFRWLKEYGLYQITEIIKHRYNV